MPKRSGGSKFRVRQRTDPAVRWDRHLRHVARGCASIGIAPGSTVEIEFGPVVLQGILEQLLYAHRVAVVTITGIPANAKRLQSLSGLTVRCAASAITATNANEQSPAA